MAHLFCEGGERCPYDYVEVYGGNTTASRRLGRFCGYSSPQVLISSGSMMLRFVSDATTRDRGWVARYVASGQSWTTYEPDFLWDFQLREWAL